MNIDDKLADLKKRRKALLRRHEKLIRASEELESEYDALQQQKLRESLGEMVGKTIRVPKGICGDTRIAGRSGTLTKVNRTLALVDFGDIGRFRIPMEWIARDGEEEPVSGLLMTF